MQSETLKCALRYVALGWFVIPLHAIQEDGECTCNAACSDKGKHPRLRNWKKEASNDLTKLREWFGEGAEPSNIGIVTGERSDITVIDIDVAKDKRGDETWNELNREFGEPNTLFARTGSGGLHAVFKYNSALKTSSDTLGKGVDCRNDSGYIVAAPSMHRSGNRYEWINWDVATEEPTLAHLPAHLSKPVERRGRPKKGQERKKKVGLEELAAMLRHVPADDRDTWRNVGIILGREFNRSDEAWKAYCDWSATWTGKKGRNHDEIMREAFYDISQQATSRELSVGTIVALALTGGWVPKRGDLPLDSFLYYAPGNNYIYRPTGDPWIASAVDAGVSPVNVQGDLLSPSIWLQRNSFVSSMTSDPSMEEELLKGFDCRSGEIITSVGGCVYNTYRRPTIELGDPKLAKPWLDHVHRVFNKQGDADQFVSYMAHRVQSPGDKPRFALLIAGEQGTGKDTAIELCIPAIGAWNVANIEPAALDMPYNEYEAKTLVRISETANLHEMSKWSFNERTKVLIAGNPDHVEINPKYGVKFSVRRYCGVVLTTNHLASGIYIPADDRRYDVIDSATKRDMGFGTDEDSRVYFEDLWNWFRDDDGDRHVAAFLHQRDLKGWSPNNARKTAAHKAVVQSSASTDEWLLDIIEQLQNKKLLRGDVLILKAVEAGMKESDAKVKLAHALGRIGYVQVLCPNTKDGRWQASCNGRNKYVRVYAANDEGRPSPAEMDALLNRKELF